MPDVTALVEELQRYGVPNDQAHLLVAKAIIIGADAAVYRIETATKLAELMVERQRQKGRDAA